MRKSKRMPYIKNIECKICGNFTTKLETLHLNPDVDFCEDCFDVAKIILKKMGKKLVRR